MLNSKTSWHNKKSHYQSNRACKWLSMENDSSTDLIQLFYSFSQMQWLRFKIKKKLSQFDSYRFSTEAKP